MRRLLKLLNNNKCVKRSQTIFLSLFCAYLALIYSIISIIKNRGKFFQVRRRPVPPNCLNDPTLGTHRLIQLNVMLTQT